MPAQVIPVTPPTSFITREQFDAIGSGLPVVASAAARDALYPTPHVNDRAYRTDTKSIERYNGTAWVVDMDANGGIPVFANQAARDAAFPVPGVNQRAYRIDTKTIERYDVGTSSWVPDIVTSTVGPKGDKGDQGSSGPAGLGVTAVSTLSDRDALTPSVNTRILVQETGEGYRWNGTRYVLEQARPAAWLDVKASGALGDGLGTTIAAYNASIGKASSYRRADWLGTYADTDTMDYAGFQEAVYHAWAGVASTPGNIVWNSNGNSAKNYRVYVSTGSYDFGSKGVYCQDVLGTEIFGDGRYATFVMNHKQLVPVFQTNGFSRSIMRDIFWNGAPDGTGVARGFWWKSRVYNVGDRIYSTNTSSINTSGGGTVYPGDIFQCITAGTSGASAPNWASTDASKHLTDGTVVWQQVSTLANTAVVLFDYDGAGFSGTLQAVTIANCDFQTTNANSHSVGIQIGTGLQAQGSEFTILNCHTLWPPVGLRTLDFDSYAIQILGGNIGGNNMHGIHAVRGSVYVRGTGFQNGTCGTLNEGNIQYGWDIYCEGSADTISRASAIRSESARIAATGNAHMLVLDTFEHIPNGVARYGDLGPSHSGITLGFLVYSDNTAKTDGAVWEATAITTGITGAVEPTWVGNAPTVVDGGVTWTQRNPLSLYGDGLHASNGNVRYGQCSIESSDTYPSGFAHLIVSRPDWIVRNVGLGCRRSKFFAHHITVKIGGGMGSGPLYPNEYNTFGSPSGPLTRNPYSFGDAFLNFHNHLGVIGFGLVDHQDIADADLANTFRSYLALEAWSRVDTGWTVAPPRTNDTGGKKLRLWGGPGRGNGAPGQLVGSTSRAGSSGPAVQPPVDGWVLDEFGTFTTNFGLVRGTQPIAVGAAGTATIDSRAGSVVRITAAGNFTMADPTNPTDGQELEIEVFNNTAGAITITQAASFAVGITAPAAGKRTTVRVRYSTAGGRNKWSPITPQVADYS